MVMSDSEKIALDATKFTLQTLGKDIYTVKTEKEENVTVTHKLDDEQMERIARRMNDKLASKV